jgi:hypothetical protein
MHADFHELTGIAAGARPEDGHVGTCPDCRAELGRIRRVRSALQALPSHEAPEGAWEAARSRVKGRAAPAVLAPARVAMAASLVTMLAAALLFARPKEEAADATAAIPMAQPLAGLVAENSRLEAVLAGLPATRATRAGTAYTVATLEDRLALVDERLTVVSLEPYAPEVAEDLWRERVTLMNSLVQVHYANAVASR